MEKHPATSFAIDEIGGEEDGGDLGKVSQYLHSGYVIWGGHASGYVIWGCHSSRSEGTQRALRGHSEGTQRARG